VRLSHAIRAASNFRVAFHTGEDLHFVGMVAGLGGTTEQLHLSARRMGTGPILDAERMRFPLANWVFGQGGELGCVHGNAPFSESPPHKKYCAAIGRKLFKIAQSKPVDHTARRV
jgi:hypothetical protein